MKRTKANFISRFNYTQQRANNLKLIVFKMLNCLLYKEKHLQRQDEEYLYNIHAST